MLVNQTNFCYVFKQKQRMLQSNECPLGESLRGMPMAKVAKQRISARNADG